MPRRTRPAAGAAAVSAAAVLSLLFCSGPAQAVGALVSAETARYVNTHHVNVEVDYHCAADLGAKPRIEVYVGQGGGAAMFGARGIVCDGEHHSVIVRTEAERPDCPDDDVYPGCFAPFDRGRDVTISTALTADGQIKADSRVSLVAGPPQTNAGAPGTATARTEAPGDTQTPGAGPSDTAEPNAPRPSTAEPGAE
jgi:hypothetical protein